MFEPANLVIFMCETVGKFVHTRRLMRQKIELRAATTASALFSDAELYAESESAPKIGQAVVIIELVTDGI